MPEQCTITESEVISLLVEDQKRFADAILKPRSPTRELKKAAKAHQNLIEPS